MAITTESQAATTLLMTTTIMVTATVTMTTSMTMFMRITLTTIATTIRTSFTRTMVMTIHLSSLTRLITPQSSLRVTRLSSKTLTTRIWEKNSCISLDSCLPGSTPTATSSTARMILTRQERPIRISCEPNAANRKCSQVHLCKLSTIKHSHASILAEFAVVELNDCFTGPFFHFM